MTIKQILLGGGQETTAFFVNQTKVPYFTKRLYNPERAFILAA